MAGFYSSIALPDYSIWNTAFYYLLRKSHYHFSDMGFRRIA
jgi:hypothetical protein